MGLSIPIQKSRSEKKGLNIGMVESRVKTLFNSLLALTQYFHYSMIPILQVSLQRASVLHGFAQGDLVDILQITAHRDPPGNARNQDT